MTMNVNGKQPIQQPRVSAVEVLGPGKTGPAVKALQEGLNKLGYTLVNDGSYGPKTTAAVKDFQKDNNLNVDGIAGPATMATLKRLLGVKAPTKQSEPTKQPVKQSEPVKQPVKTEPTTSPVKTEPTTTPVKTEPTTPTDTVEVSEPNYPTVGDYVKGEFKHTMDNVVTGMHFTAELLPPVLLAEIGTIKAKHEMNASKRIWDLPMDPEGKWKDKARAIMDEEATLASKEIAELPMVKAMNIAAVTVKEGIVWTGQQIKNGVVWAGNAAVDGAVAVGVATGKGIQAVGRGVTWVGEKVEDGAVAAGEAVRDGARAIKEGVEWTGEKIAEGAQAVGDAAKNGARAIGTGARWIGHEYVEANKSVARGFLSGIKAIGQFLTGTADKGLPNVQPTPFHK